MAKRQKLNEAERDAYAVFFIVLCMFVLAFFMIVGGFIYALGFRS